MSSDSPNLLMSMVEKVCAPVLEQVLDRVELQALREASTHLRTENAELRQALQIPRGVFASAEMIATAAQRHRERAATQATGEGAEVLEPETGSKPANDLPPRGAVFLLWPFALAPARVQQLAPARDVQPAWALMYQRSLAEVPEAAEALERLRHALQTPSTPHDPARRRTPSQILEFIW